MVTLLRSGRVAIEETTVAAGGFRFRARVAGPPDGELVMLLHGFPQSSRCWIEALETLGDAGYRAVAPDQRGYSPGACPEGVEGYRMSALVADVTAECLCSDDGQWRYRSHILQPIFVGRDIPHSISIDPKFLSKT